MKTCLKGAKCPLKSGVLGVKSRFLGLKNDESEPKQKGKMVLNAGSVRQNGQKEKRVGRELVAKCPLNGSCFR